ncbi:MAG: 3-hydroxyacyl-CoA dehydrogenase NAD-binding domain-containing protein [Ignavibacteriales bacterium]
MKTLRVGIAGAGTMGQGIAIAAAIKDHEIILYDIDPVSLENAGGEIQKTILRQKEKGLISDEQSHAAQGLIHYTCELKDLSNCGIIIEAAFEDLNIKKQIFSELEAVVSSHTILASNTSSLSIASIAAASKVPSRVIGMHFFNPAHLMQLVEIVPGLNTIDSTVERTVEIARSWDKIPVIAKDTPGFIVNRIARPYYGEALRILEEGNADVATIDWAMREAGGFRMGPFELMDLIGNDVNYKVTETVFENFYFDPRYRPSIIQKRYVEAGLLGRKSGRGFYDYSPQAKRPEPVKDAINAQEIWFRIISMIINEACDALFLKVASVKDIDLAMTKGVNYPKGPLSWADEIGPDKVLVMLRRLQDEYGEDRYRSSPLLKRMVRHKQRFNE